MPGQGHRLAHGFVNLFRPNRSRNCCEELCFAIMVALVFITVICTILATVGLVVLLTLFEYVATCIGVEHALMIIFVIFFLAQGGLGAPNVHNDHPDHPILERVIVSLLACGCFYVLSLAIYLIYALLGGIIKYVCLLVLGFVLTAAYNKHTSQRGRRSMSSNMSSITQQLSNPKTLFRTAIGDYVDCTRSTCSGAGVSIEAGHVSTDISFEITLCKPSGQPYTRYSSGFVDVAIEGPSATIPTIQDQGMGTLTASYSVVRSGQYTIHVRANGQHINGSPFLVNIASGPINPTKTVIKSLTDFGSGDLARVVTVGVSHALILITYDDFNNQCSEGGHASSFKLLASGIGREGFRTVITDEGDGTYKVDLQANTPGAFDVSVEFKGDRIRSASFTILSLTQPQAKAVAGIGKYEYFKAHLSRIKAGKESPKTVWIFMTPAQIAVRKYTLGVIFSSLHRLRLRVATKMTLSTEDNETFTLDDGGMTVLELKAKDRNVLYALYMKFMNSKFGSSDSREFQDKRTVLNAQLSKIHQEKRISRSIDIKIKRETLVPESISALGTGGGDSWRYKFSVRFRDEPGLDWGGLRREWFQVVAAKLFAPGDSPHDLFTTLCPDSLAVHPNAKCQDLNKYRFAGLLLGKLVYDTAVYEPTHVGIRFSRSFYKQIIGIGAHYNDFATDDPQLYKSKIKYILENDIDDAGLDMTFVEEVFDDQQQKVRDDPLKPGGDRIGVTQANKREYLYLLAQYRLVTPVCKQMESLLAGFHQLVPDDSLSIFDESELELLFCGVTEYSVESFKQHVQLTGFSGTSQEIVWFWVAVENFNTDDRAKLIQFITGSSQLPVGGFKNLTPAITISKISFLSNHLPRAHTCFNTLDLPSYTSFEELQRMLRLAVTEGNEGFGMV